MAESLFITNAPKCFIQTYVGSTTGLGLILNVEQYEYMRGPQNDAGVKVMNRTCSGKIQWECTV